MLTSGQAIGRSRGGSTIKIVSLVDALGTLVRFVLLPGHRHDSVGVAPLIESITFDILLGAKGFDNDPLRAEPKQRKVQAVIPKRNARPPSPATSPQINGDT